MILHRRPLADRGSPGRTNGNAVINPRIRVCSTVVLRSCLQPRATALWCLRSVSVNGGMPAPSLIDNEHQSSSVTTGCPTVCSTTSTISSTTAATHGTSWRLSPGLSCPSACAIGPIGSDQRDLVLGLSLTSTALPARRGTCLRPFRRPDWPRLGANRERAWLPAAPPSPNQRSACRAGWVTGAFGVLGCHQLAPEPLVDRPNCDLPNR